MLRSIFRYSLRININKCLSISSHEFSSDSNKFNPENEDKMDDSESEKEIENSLPSTLKSYKSFLETKNALGSKNVNELLKESVSKEIQEEASGEWMTPVYPKFKGPSLFDQSKQSLRPKVDPKETTAILFPGQGSQFVGMGTNVIDVPYVPEMFNIAKKVLGYDLLHLCLNGPIENLNQTQYCQPAVFVTSLAAVERLRVTRPGEAESCVAVAGFSVGELAALVFAGALTFEDGLRLVKIRAEAMQYTSDLVPSGMMTVFFTPAAKVNLACLAAKEWCIKKGIGAEHAECSVANYLFPHCKVIAGHQEALSFLEINAKDFGIRKSKRLPVSGAFHTKLMKPAKEIFQNALRHVKIVDPLIPVYSNFDGKMYQNADSIKEKLVKQIIYPVKWEQTLHTIYERKREIPVPKTYECGPGTALLSVLGMVNGIARRNAVHVPV